MLLEELTDRLSFVRREIVQDDVNLLPRGTQGDDLLQKGDELTAGMVGGSFTVDATGGGIQRRIQGERSVPVVLKTVAFGASWRERQDGIETIQSLNGGLLIDAEHGRVLGRVQIEAKDVGRFDFEIGIIAGHVALAAFSPRPASCGWRWASAAASTPWSRSSGIQRQDSIACEVFDDGICSLLSRLVAEAARRQRMARHLRLWADDAPPLLRLSPDRCLDRLFLLFPILAEGASRQAPLHPPGTAAAAGAPPQTGRRVGRRPAMIHLSGVGGRGDGAAGWFDAASPTTERPLRFGRQRATRPSCPRRPVAAGTGRSSGADAGARHAAPVALRRHLHPPWSHHAANRQSDGSGIQSAVEQRGVAAYQRGKHYASSRCTGSCTGSDAIRRQLRARPAAAIAAARQRRRVLSVGNEDRAAGYLPSGATAPPVPQGTRSTRNGGDSCPRRLCGAYASVGGQHDKVDVFLPRGSRTTIALTTPRRRTVPCSAGRRG